jgi:hypothetical protein
MITVKVDGQPFAADISQIRTMGELVELIKATIDPDTIITSLMLEGRSLSDTDWRLPLSAQKPGTLEVSTGDKSVYLTERLKAADSYLEKIIEGFSTAANLYSAKSVEDANRKLASTVEDLLAFVNWYASLLAMDDTKVQMREGEFDGRIRQIKTICDSMLQQQMFHSWAILGETLQNNLKPELERLREFCQSMAK